MKKLISFIVMLFFIVSFQSLMHKKGIPAINIPLATLEATRMVKADPTREGLIKTQKPVTDTENINKTIIFSL